MGSEENDLRARSFRNEDYTNRRAFLRSYPLHWGGEDEHEEENKHEPVRVSEGDDKKRPIKKMIISVFHWGEGRVLVLRRFKHKIGFYIIACLPVGFKPPTALIAV
ncbi:hypothetical protein Acr_29g0003160 [Actinidia rufa]|uniref:Uncharacterized protein n=1 Tax=Actinidia rufa TaxID=165716 RepID=A0A7J0HEJ9_9ERIC|nr:hypothetical protein Acr_29g0003160 [Actinidia rufa]